MKGICFLPAPDELVLLSDFESYHYVINYWFYPIDEIEDDEFDKLLAKNGLTSNDIKDFERDSPLLREIRKKIELSWEKIFDLDWYHEYCSRPRSEKWIQATLWEIKWEWVADVKEFVAK